MKRNLLAATIAALSFSSVQAGEAVFYVTEDGQAVKDISVKVDGQKKLVGKNGFVAFELKGGNHQVELSQYGELTGEFEFDASSHQNAEVQVELIAGEAMADVALYVPGKDTGEASALGKISGYLESDETGGGVESAIISVVGTAYTTTTDNKGFYQLEIPRGEYALKIAHPNYGNREVKRLRVISQVSTNVNLNLSMSGEGVIEEVLAVGSYVPSTVTAQQRDASGVLDAIGAEQFSRFGDSNAASALKRVSGVSIAGGKYAVVRGLNERYTSVLFNGASLPSPDPTRRVVPLDLFPSGIISSINVEKTANPHRPADSAGATIDIISREAPDSFEGKLSVSTGHLTGTTGESARVQKTSGMEALGFGSSDRNLSSAAENYANTRGAGAVTGEEGVALLNHDQWQTENINIKPDLSLEASVGDLIGEYSFGDLAYKVTGRYSNEWKKTETDNATYNNLGNGSTIEEDEYVETRVVNDIDLSGALALSLLSDNYSVMSNTMLLRQTQIDSSEEVGVRSEYRNFTINRNYSWQEREFFMQQFTGDFDTPELLDAHFKWGATFAKAKLDAPDSRSYTLTNDNSIAVDDIFNPLAQDETALTTIDMSTSPQRSFTKLEDDATDFQIAGDIQLLETDKFQIRLNAGVGILSRDRDVSSSTFIYELTNEENIIPDDYENEQDISSVINDGSISSGDFSVSPQNDFKASYIGSWDNSSVFFMPSLEWFDLLKVEAGVRLEDSTMKIKTSTDPITGNTVEASVKDDDLYPSLNISVTPLEDLKIRLAYYESINRPDFREVAPAQFIDTVSGDTYKGNENLVSANIDNLDLRFEYYFSDTESASLALFRKDFDGAIERTADVLNGSSNSVIYSFDNNGDSFAEGVEVAASKDFEFSESSVRISANASFFDTEIEIYSDSGNLIKKRQLQGQPELLANMQISLDEYESGREYTLVINHIGESLHAVSADPLLGDEMKLARTVLDVNFKQPIIMDELDFKASIKNLFDAEIEHEQNGKMAKKYKPGIEFKMGVSYLF